MFLDMNGTLESPRKHADPVVADPKPSPTRIRLSLDVSPELDQLLESTAAKIGGTKSDVLRKAIVLMNVVVNAQAENKVFGVANSDSEPISKQIVGLF